MYDNKHLIGDWLKKFPKDIDLLYKNKRKNKKNSSNEIINNNSNDKFNYSLSFDDNIEINTNKKQNKYVYNNNLDLIKEDEKEDETDKNDKFELGYLSAPEDSNNNILNIIYEDFDINENKKKVNFVFNDNNINNNRKKKFERRETRSKSQAIKKLNSDIEYLLSRRKDKDIYNIRWKIVRQFVKKIKEKKNK